jgi:hypothetical protein
VSRFRHLPINGSKGPQQRDVFWTLLIPMRTWCLGSFEDYKILGGPHWTETDRYNLEAKPGASSTLRQWVPEQYTRI